MSPVFGQIEGRRNCIEHAPPQSLCMQKATKNSRVAWDTRKGFDNQEPRPIYVGNYDDWDPEETSKQRWTEPTTPGAKKAIHSKEDPEVFKIGRYLCCHDPECGVSVKVVQASKVTWHFKRQWNYGDNPAHRDKCINERMYRGGESMYHNTTTRTVARLLTPGKKLDGKTVAKKAEWEVFRNFQSKDGESVILKPDVYVEFTDGTWFAIEVVFGHPPERNAHDAYGDNMVEIDLDRLGVVDSEQSFFKWIREGGIEKALKRDSKEKKRIQRFHKRQKMFERGDEKAYLAARKEQISICEERYGIQLPDGVLSQIKTIEGIKAAFVDEVEKIRTRARVAKAIERNSLKYGKTGRKQKFSSPLEVDEYYQKMFGAELAEKERKNREWAAEREEYRKRRKQIRQKKEEFENEEGYTISSFCDTVAEVNRVIRLFYEHRDSVTKNTQDVAAKFALYQEKRNSLTPNQRLDRLRQLENSVRSIESGRSFWMIEQRFPNEQLQAVSHSIHAEKRLEKATIRDKDSQYIKWFEDYRISLAKFLSRKEYVKSQKKAKELLSVLTEYWKEVNVFDIIPKLISEEVLQYDVSTVENLLKVPIMSCLTRRRKLASILVVNSTLDNTEDSKIIPLELPSIRKMDEIERQRQEEEDDRRKKRREKRKEKTDKKDKDSYYRLKKNLTYDANNTNVPPKTRKEAKRDLDKLIQNEGKKWGDPDAS